MQDKEQIPTDGPEPAREAVGGTQKECVIVLAPLGQDGPMLVQALQSASIDAVLYSDLQPLLENLPGCLAAILTIEALAEPQILALETVLKQQPPWSDVPILLLAGRVVLPSFEARVRAIGNITVLQRPLVQSSMYSVVKSAIRARQRQYEVRDLLEQSALQQAHIEALNERLQRAMTETHHRVKNNLQVIAAMVDMQSTQDNPTVPREQLKNLAAHIRTMAVVHNLLTRQAKENGQTDCVSAQEILEQLLPQLQRMASPRTFQTDLQDAKLSARQGTSLALVVNELITNAIKYGEGVVTVRFTCEKRCATLVVYDEGPGFPEGFDAVLAAHTGLELVGMLSRWDLGGEARFENRPEGGARVQVTVPLTA